MIAPRIALLLATATIGLGALASCGGEDSSTTERTDAGTEASLPHDVVTRANRNCLRMRHDLKQVWRRAAQRSYRSALELTVEGYTAPGLRLIKRLAVRQKALQPAAADSRFALYVSLFDPIVALGEQGLRAGRAEDIGRVTQLRDLLIGLGADQRKLARRAGLRDCDVDFLESFTPGANP